MKKDIEASEKVQKRATKILPQLKHMNYSGGGGATALPLWPDHNFFWLILHCFVGFISWLNHMKSVSRGMDVRIIACYYNYTDVHARPEASIVTCPCLQLRRGSYMYCWRTSTDGLWQTLFIVTDMRHRWYVHWRHRARASRGRLMTLWPGSRTVDSHGDLRDLRQIVNCKHW